VEDTGKGENAEVPLDVLLFQVHRREVGGWRWEVVGWRGRGSRSGMGDGDGESAEWKKC